MRLLVRYLLLLCGLSLMPVAQVVAGLPDTIDKIRGGVVGIGTVFPNKGPDGRGQLPTFRGTGFVVGNGRQVVTNFHVIQKPLDNEKKELLAVFSGEGKASRVYPAKLIRTDEAHDLALLEIAGPALPPLVVESSRTLREGEEVAFTGFPIGLVLGLQPVTHRGIVSAVTPIVMPAMSSATLTAAQIKRARQPFEVYQLDATAYPGSSGSPVYDVETGRVVAVINSVFVKESKEAMLHNPSAISYAIPSAYVNALLEAAAAAQ